ncbi:MAG: ribosome biogenesis/translation initiation ATPase RLI [Candidatus Nanoarchaeia archaeon]|nr:ribosome biogenesis/translation initiation ATPase RLI [Candidatus Nanoarchaeia archaeon]MDD3994045.1 ribosome biogenesis/translation initiation ATPase RLI [Candidatus Nanoarchaeia archaeon]MDD4563339.1 ribosome biogenesis/translation initiation ATPase RLI [Candidatus Nanoarchaeia archaeon]
MTRIAIIHKEKCRPEFCSKECKRYCPIEKKEQDTCILIENKASINEDTCIGCSICQRRCPFEAIEIINLPSVKSEDLVHRFGENGFALYGLPTPKKGKVLGLLGRNGIGKTTAVKILAGIEKPNLGKNANDEEIKTFFQGTELLNYIQNKQKLKIAYKPQNLSMISQNVKVLDLLKKLGEEEKIKEFSEKLNIFPILNNKLNKLSGGELQRVAIIAAFLKQAEIYLIDEPLAYLDIQQRLIVSDFIQEQCKDKTVIIVEHDLLILDYLTDYLNIFYGTQGGFGAVSNIRFSKNGVNSYLEGFLKDENVRIRDKELKFDFTKNPQTAGQTISSWPNFEKEFESGFKLKINEGQIKKNHCIGILGKNGIGKTTFVKCLAGLEKVKINNKEQKLNLNLNLSYKPQYLFTESQETVKEIIFKEKMDKRIVQTFNLTSLQQKRLNQLSGGELQRLFLAQCLSKDADIYLIDEPSAYLDVEERINVAKSIKDLMIEKEKTAFIIDHDLLLISYLADSIINFDGESGVYGECSQLKSFKEGITDLLKSLDITLRKDIETKRPRINKKDSFLDREQKQKKEWAIF